MSGFQGQTLSAGGDGIGAVAVILKSNILAVQKLLGNARVTMEIPALALGVNVPAIDAVAAVLQDITDACIACGEGQLAARLNKDVGAFQRSTVVVDRGVCTQLCGCTSANDQTAALPGQIFLLAAIFLCGIVVGNGNIGSVLNGKLTAAVAEDTGHSIVFDSYSAVLDRQVCVSIHEPQTSIPIRFALCTGNGDGGVIADFSFAGEDDARQTVIFSSNSGVLHSQIAGRQAVRTVAAEVDVRAVFDVIVRTVRAVAAAIDDVYITVIYCYIEGADKAGTVIVGGEGGTAGNIAVVTAVTAVPFQSIMLIVLDRQVGTVLNVQLIVGTEIDGMCITGSTCAVHRHVGVVQREGSILAGANGHPLPFGSIRCAADTLHLNMHILEGQICAPQSDALLFKGEFGLDDGLFYSAVILCFGGRFCDTLNGKFLIYVHSGGLGVFDHFNDVVVLGCIDGVVKARIALTVNGGNSFGLRRSGGRSSGRSRSWCQRGSHQHRSLCCRRFCKDFILNGSILLVLVGSFLLGLVSGLLLSFVSGLLHGLVSGLLLGLVSGLLLGLVSGLLLGLVSGLLLGLVSGLLLGLASGLLLGFVGSRSVLTGRLSRRGRRFHRRSRAGCLSARFCICCQRACRNTGGQSQRHCRKLEFFVRHDHSLLPDLHML